MKKLSAMLGGLLVAGVLIAVTPGAASAACDYSDADQNGGWGWDPVARTSCPPQEDPEIPETPEPEEPAVPDQLERPDIPIPDLPTPGTRWCSTDPAGLDFDSDADGWGWEHGHSCRVQFPRAYNPDLEDRVAALISNASGGRALSETERRTVARHIVAAYGNRPDLISYWADKATRMKMIEKVSNDDGTYIGGWNRCHSYGWHRWEYKKNRGVMALTATEEFIVVHEFAHAIDCSDSSNSRTDGIGRGMTAAEHAALVAERGRLFDEWTSVDRGELSSDIVAGLRYYAFENNVEFFAEASEVFLSRSNKRRIAMAQEAPKLYDMMRTYYNMDHWPAAEDVEGPRWLLPTDFYDAESLNAKL